MINVPILKIKIDHDISFKMTKSTEPSGAGANKAESTSTSLIAILVYKTPFDPCNTPVVTLIA